MALTGVLLVTLLLASAGHAGAAERVKTYKVGQVLTVGRAFSGIPISFHLHTHGNRQFVAYYNADRQLVVAARRLNSKRWTKRTLPERNPWDSHNDVTMTVDREGLLHLAANMHGDPLNYYRTAKPYAIDTFKQINRMVGKNEQQCTYPNFLRGADGQLLFMYRDGGSGDGQRLINVYDPTKRTWRRWLDKPLLDGQGRMNAYPLSPRRGPNGQFHVAWMWRNTPDAATNHDLSYMRSPDLKHWYTARGERLRLPVTPSNEKVVVDPVPPGEGLLNSAFDLGFDHRGRPVLAYHKYDANGSSQIYNARWETDHWAIYQTSDFDFRWDFGGPGTLPGPSTGAGGIRVLDDGRLVQSYHTTQGDRGTWQLNPRTLKPTGEVTLGGYRVPAALQQPRSEFPGMQVRWHHDAGQAPQPEVVYMLRHETLGANRDFKRKEVPKAAPLKLYKFIKPRDDAN